MADAIDSKSVVLWACGFDPRLRYHAEPFIFQIISRFRDAEMAFSLP